MPFCQNGIWCVCYAETAVIDSILNLLQLNRERSRMAEQIELVSHDIYRLAIVPSLSSPDRVAIETGIPHVIELAHRGQASAAAINHLL